MLGRVLADPGGFHQPLGRHERPGPRRDAVSRRAAVSHVEPLDRQVGRLEPDARAVEAAQERGERRVVGRIDLDQPQPGTRRARPCVSTSVT